MFSSIKREGDFEFGPGIKSKYDYDYASLSDTMNEAYCQCLIHKLEKWQIQHGKFNVVLGIETQGIRIGYQLSKMMGLQFFIIPHRVIDMEAEEMPQFPPDTHFLIVDDIVTTGSSFLRAIDFLSIEEKPETFTLACMIKTNLANIDYSAVHGNLSKEQFQVRDERFDFIDQRLIALYSEPE
ncbi:MAG: hypothetical protein IIA62_09525 [Nitrospinae bacterium]|nr:hypothetical protein [Nitrospinota bacterium]